MDNNMSSSVAMSLAVASTDGASGSASIEGAVLDMDQYESVLVVIRMGAITSGAATSIKMQSGTDDTVSDAADLLGTSQTIVDTADNTVFYIDLVKPIERYVRLYISRATQASTVDSAMYIQYNPRTYPTTQGTSVSGELHVEPIEGTA